MEVILEVPTHADSLKIIQGHARLLADVSGFKSPRAGLIELACEEAFILILERADKTQTSNIKFCAEITPLALKVSFDDREIPPMPFEEAQNSPSHISLESYDVGHMSEHLIRQSADVARWQPLGRQGNRLLMIFNRPKSDIRSLEDPKFLQVIPEDIPEESNGPYSLRCAGTHDNDFDWHQIARVMYRTYGFTYFYDDFYIPDRIRELNKSKQVLSIVATTPSNEVVGHYALDVHGFGQLGTKECIIGELGKAVVHPSHRGQGLMEKMRNFTEAQAREQGLLAVFSQPTTAHSFSQKANESLGAHVCALNIAHVGTHMNLKEINQSSATQRTSSFIYFKSLIPPGKRIIFPPKQHIDFIQKTYSACEIPITIESSIPPSKAYSEIEVEYYRSADFGSIKIRNVGEDIGQKLRLCRDDLVRKSGTRVIFLNLCLEDPSCEIGCQFAETLGFYYSGIAPYHDNGKDVLRLQYIDTAFDLKALSVAGSFAKELVSYIEADRIRIEDIKL
ncbi:MAG: GNAT family N-acetyltransferase [Hyphomicrobium sp.]